MSINSKMAALADSIRGKSGAIGPLGLDAMKAAIDGIEPGSIEEACYAESGSFALYKPVMNFSSDGLCNLWNCVNLKEVHAPGFTGQLPENFIRGCSLCRVVELPECTGLHNRVFQSSGLTAVYLPKVSSIRHNYPFGYMESLKTVQLGSIGHPVNSTVDSWNVPFGGCTQSDLTITLYVSDDTPIPFSGSPWGAANATIIYRSAATGEVRTV